MRVVVVGTNHAGISAANTLLDSDQDVEVTLIDRNSNLSYLGCGTALWVGRQIDSYEGLFYTNAADFEAKGAKVSLETEVKEIDFENKVVYAETKSGEKLEENYDKLVLATGSLPIAPKLPGNDLEGLHFLKLFQEGQEVDKALAADDANVVCVIGAGYIGVEIAEAAARRGKEVHIFDAEEHSLMNYYDVDFAVAMDENLRANGIHTHFGELAEEYLGENGKVTGLKTTNGEYKADVIINCIGFRPNAGLGAGHLDTFVNGAYLVDRTFKTNDDSVYAVGDCATNYSNAINDTAYIALASNAVRSGIVAGQNILGNHVEGAGIQGSNGIEIFGLKLVSTGLSVRAAEKNGLKVNYTDIEDTQLPSFMPAEENAEVKLRIVYEEESRRIVGAQMVSRYDISMGIHMFSLAVQEQLTVDKLALLDLFFLPHFNQPYNYITKAALKAE